MCNILYAICYSLIVDIFEELQNVGISVSSTSQDLILRIQEEINHGSARDAEEFNDWFGSMC